MRNQLLGLIAVVVLSGSTTAAAQDCDLTTPWTVEQPEDQIVVSYDSFGSGYVYSLDSNGKVFSVEEKVSLAQVSASQYQEFLLQIEGLQAVRRTSVVADQASEGRRTPAMRDRVYADSGTFSVLVICAGERDVIHSITVSEQEQFIEGFMATVRDAVSENGIACFVEPTPDINFELQQ